MKARDHTHSMLAWWWQAAISRADLMVHRRGGPVWHRDRPLSDLHLSWLGHANAAGAEIYIRPARHHAWAVIFLDDVESGLAHRIVRKYRALAIRTSPAGGCHIWLQTATSLDEDERAASQRYLAPLINADPASTSGEHLGRLAGFRNWKRDGVWVGVLASSKGAHGRRASISLRRVVRGEARSDRLARAIRVAQGETGPGSARNSKLEQNHSSSSAVSSPVHDPDEETTPAATRSEP